MWPALLGVSGLGGLSYGTHWLFKYPHDTTKPTAMSLSNASAELAMPVPSPLIEFNASPAYATLSAVPVVIEAQNYPTAPLSIAFKKQHPRGPLSLILCGVEMALFILPCIFNTGIIGLISLLGGMIALICIATRKSKIERMSLSAGALLLKLVLQTLKSLLCWGYRASNKPVTIRTSRATNGILPKHWKIILTQRRELASLRTQLGERDAQISNLKRNLAITEDHLKRELSKRDANAKVAGFKAVVEASHLANETGATNTLLRNALHPEGWSIKEDDVAELISEVRKCVHTEVKKAQRSRFNVVLEHKKAIARKDAIIAQHRSNDEERTRLQSRLNTQKQAMLEKEENLTKRQRKFKIAKKEAKAAWEHRSQELKHMEAAARDAKEEGKAAKANVDNRIAELQTQHKAELTKAEKEVSNLKERLNDMTRISPKIHEELVDQYRHLHADRDRLSRALASISKDCDARIEKHQNKLEGLQQAMDKSNGEAKDRKMKLKEAENKIVSKQRIAESVSKELNAKIASLKKSNERITNTLAAKENEFKDSRKRLIEIEGEKTCEVMDLKGKVHRLQVDCDELKLNKEKLEKRYARRKAKSPTTKHVEAQAQAQDTIQEQWLQQRIDTLIAEKSEMEVQHSKELAAAQQEITGLVNAALLQKQEATLQPHHHPVACDHTEQSKELKYLRDSLKEEKDRNSSSEQIIHNQNINISGLQAQILSATQMQQNTSARYTNEIMHQEDEINRLNNILNVQSQRCAAIESELAQAGNTAESNKTAMQTIKTKLADEETRRRDAVETNKIAMQAIEDKLAEVETRRRDADTEVETMKDQLEEANKKIQEQQNAVSSMTAELYDAILVRNSKAEEIAYLTMEITRARNIFYEVTGKGYGDEALSVLAQLLECNEAMTIVKGKLEFIGNQPHRDELQSILQEYGISEDDVQKLESEPLPYLKLQARCAIQRRRELLEDLEVLPAESLHLALYCKLMSPRGDEDELDDPFPALGPDEGRSTELSNPATHTVYPDPTVQAAYPDWFDNSANQGYPLINYMGRPMLTPRSRRKAPANTSYTMGVSSIFDDGNAAVGNVRLGSSTASHTARQGQGHGEHELGGRCLLTSAGSTSASQDPQQAAGQAVSSGTTSFDFAVLDPALFYDQTLEALTGSTQFQTSLGVDSQEPPNSSSNQRDSARPRQSVGY